MSETGQTRHFDRAPITSGLPRKADNFRVGRHVSKVPNSDMTLIRRPQKKKPPRRRLFNTGRCGVGQRFSHVYSRPTQPLQDSQRDRRNERPDHITEFVCEDCGDHAHVFGHYYGLPVRSTCPLHPRTSDMPEHIIKRHLRGDTW